ncbi:MAG: dihydroorotate oxidase, partial [Ktedonobacteraceae bacterium]
MLHTPFFDPERSYIENFEHGPFGAFADGVALPVTGEPEYNVLGQQVSLPFGVPAGPLLNGKYIKAALD